MSKKFALLRRCFMQLCILYRWHNVKCRSKTTIWPSENVRAGEIVQLRVSRIVIVCVRSSPQRICCSPVCYRCSHAVLIHAYTARRYSHTTGHDHPLGVAKTIISLADLRYFISIYQTVYFVHDKSTVLLIGHNTRSRKAMKIQSDATRTTPSPVLSTLMPLIHTSRLILSVTIETIKS